MEFRWIIDNRITKRQRKNNHQNNHVQLYDLGLLFVTVYGTRALPSTSPGFPQLTMVNQLIQEYQLDRYIIPRNRLTVLERLGVGNFGEVYDGRLFGRGIDGALTETHVAIKSLKGETKKHILSKEFRTVHV